MHTPPIEIQMKQMKQSSGGNETLISESRLTEVMKTKNLNKYHVYYSFDKRYNDNRKKVHAETM